MHERTWVESLGETESVNLFICMDGTPVGSVDLKPPNEVWGMAEVGVMVAPNHWNEGSATEAVDLLCGYAFRERRLNNVYAKTDETTRLRGRSWRRSSSGKKGCCGEGFVDGEHVDLYRYGLLAGEWRSD